MLATLATLLTLFSSAPQAQGSVPVTQVAAGRFFTCALASSGGVKCWGDNFYGQLGDNSVIGRQAPADVWGLATGAVAVAAGEGHACALTTGGGVKCWGGNQHGEVGDGSTVQRLVPVDVSGLASGVAAIAAGGFHTCALTAAGGVKCWGENSSGQVGDGSHTDRMVPVDVPGLASGVAAIAAGAVHTCALTTGGGVKCWGYNADGQLGDNSTVLRTTPANVSGLGSGVIALSAGVLHTCALTSSGGMLCWGANSTGQLGDGTTTGRATPGAVAGLGTGVAAIAVGTYHSCALTAGGAVKCWGENGEGQLGDGTIAQRLAPVGVSGLETGAAAITAGDQHTCALTTGGNMTCWGRNSSGQLGDGTATARNVPTGVLGLSTTGIAMIASGQLHTCALTLAGGVKCWGDNFYGQLGNDSTAQSFAPVGVSGLASGVAKIASSQFHTCAVTAAGAAKCWGSNAYGNLGDGTVIDRHVPTDVLGLQTGAANVSTGPNHACALTLAGGAMCWGANLDGRVGDGSTTDRLSPVGVFGLGNGVASISAGYAYSCALLAGGGVQCWGSNFAGQLGDGTFIDRSVPGDVTGLSGILGIEAGGRHACVVTPGGGVKCWGRNIEGQLGGGALDERSLPSDVTGLSSGVVLLGGGGYHSCALTAAGGVKCWGDNTFGQLGDGTSTGRNQPVDVVGLASGVLDINAAFNHTCAITAASGVKCWGENDSGQLGDNTTMTHETPVSALIGGQSIAFAMPGQLVRGASATLAATASSGLAVTFDTWTPGTCSVTGNTVTAISAGLCGLRASQAGTGDIERAPQQLRLVVVLDEMADLDSDGIPNAVETAVGRNPLVMDNDVFSPGEASARLFAMQQYRDFLGREGDAPGIAGWTDFVTSGQYTRAQVIDAFMNSQEFAGVMAPVVRLYFAFFQRVPDYEGLMFNAGLVRGGTVTIAQLADFFATSPEFQAAYGSLGNSQYVELLYQIVLGRAPDAAGLAGWTAMLDDGTRSRGQVMLGFSESVEFQGGIANEVFVTMMYAGMLRRTPEPSGFGGWVSYLDAGTYTREQAIDGFFLSVEYRARFLP